MESENYITLYRDMGYHGNFFSGTLGETENLGYLGEDVKKVMENLPKVIKPSKIGSFSKIQLKSISIKKIQRITFQYQ